MGEERIESKETDIERKVEREKMGGKERERGSERRRDGGEKESE